MPAPKKYSRIAVFVISIYGGGLLAGEPAGPSAAPTLTTIYAFSGVAGSSPAGGLVNHNGSLYGATLAGGASNQGAVYALTPPGSGGSAWTQTVLYSFTGGSDGGSCYGNLVFDTQGAIYGVTLAGGSASAGTVFELTPPAVQGGAWTQSVLHSFTGGADGGSPVGILFGPNGSLYGVATNGGASGFGAAFQLAPPAVTGGSWTYSVIYSFAGGADGAYPGAGLILGSKGTLFGTTYVGGASNAGTVFQLTRPAKAGGPWTESVIYTFTGGSDGGYPDAAITAVSSGALFGTTSYGGATQNGTAFQLTAPTQTGGAWTHTVLHSFVPTTSDGQHPYGALVYLNSALFGTTYFGGSQDDGAVFVLKPPSGSGGSWTEQVIYNFTGRTTGGNPFGGLLAGPSGLVYGTTFAGGPIGDGTVFQLTL